MIKSVVSGLMLSVGLGLSPVASAEDVEVLHWWTSGGEAAALNVLKQDLESKGIGWEDSPVAGGGGEAAMTALRARATAGDPPTAAQMLGFVIQDWAAEGLLGNLNEVAEEENWDRVVPKALQRFAKHDGQWVSAPVNVHSTNWVWINKKALDAAGGNVPTTWNQLVDVLDAMAAKGITPIGHGGQAWQDATMFDGVVLSMGTDFYERAFLELDPDALGGLKMAEAFDRLLKLRTYVDANFSNRDWNLASTMVINGEAGMQFMGDWAKGEFLRADKVPGKDFICIRFPGTQGAVTFNSDQFAMFNVKGAGNVAAQAAMASAVMNPTFQSAFNVVKGSVPARTDVPNDDFDDCGKKGMADLAEANAKGRLFGSMAHGHAAPESVKNAVYDVVTAAFNGEYGNGADAAEALAKAVAAAQ